MQLLNNAFKKALGDASRITAKRRRIKYSDIKTLFDQASQFDFIKPGPAAGLLNVAKYQAYRHDAVFEMCLRSLANINPPLDYIRYLGDTFRIGSAVGTTPELLQNSFCTKLQNTPNFSQLASCIAGLSNMGCLQEGHLPFIVEFLRRCQRERYYRHTIQRALIGISFLSPKLPDSIKARASQILSKLPECYLERPTQTFMQARMLSSLNLYVQNHPEMGHPVSEYRIASEICDIALPLASIIVNCEGPTHYSTILHRDPKYDLQEPLHLPCHKNEGWGAEKHDNILLSLRGHSQFRNKVVQTMNWTPIDIPFWMDDTDIHQVIDNTVASQ